MRTKIIGIILLLFMLIFASTVQVSAVGLSADESALGVDQRGVVPQSLTVDGLTTDTIYRGAALSWLAATDKIVAKQAASSTSAPAFVGMALSGTTSATGIIQTFYDFYLKDKTISGSPEVGSYVYLKTRANKVSDNFYVTDGDTASLTGTVAIAAGASPVVTGTGCAFLSELNVGDSIYLTTVLGVSEVAEALVVSSITDDDTAALTGTYGGTTAVTLAGTAVYESDLTVNPTETYNAVEYFNMPVGRITGYASAGWEVRISRDIVPATAGSSVFHNLTLTGTLKVAGLSSLTGGVSVSGALQTIGKFTASAESDTRRTYYKIFEDFQMQTLGASHPVILLNDGGGGASPAVVADAFRGVARFDTTGGGGGNGSQLCLFVPLQLDDSGIAFVEARLKINTAITGCSVHFGVTDVKTYEEPFTITGGGDPVAIADDACCFSYDDGATLKEWHAAAVESTNLDTGNGQLTTPTAPVADTYQILRIDLPADGNTGIVFSVNGTAVHTLTGSFGVGDDVPLYVIVIIQESAAAPKIVDLDYICVGHVR